MKNKITNGTIGLLSKDLSLSIKAISETTNTLNTIKNTSKIISASIGAFSALKELTRPLIK